MEEEQTTISERELVITRDIDLPAGVLYRGWTTPELLMKWFAPAPWSISKVDLDLRVGGTSCIVMRSPDGDEFPANGVYLEVEPSKKLVFTDAYVSAWEPSNAPFMTAEIIFESLAENRTRYTARVMHWSVADREKHESMGFFTGWNQCLDQLIDVVSTLK